MHDQVDLRMTKTPCPATFQNPGINQSTRFHCQHFPKGVLFVAVRIIPSVGSSRHRHLNLHRHNKVTMENLGSGCPASGGRRRLLRLLADPTHSRYSNSQAPLAPVVGTRLTNPHCRVSPLYFPGSVRQTGQSPASCT